MELEIHWGNAMGFKGPDIVAGVGEGIADVAEVFHSHASMEIPAFEPTLIGYGLYSGPVESQAVLKALSPVWNEALADYGTMPFAHGIHYNGMGIWMWTMNEPKTMDDLKDLKIRGFALIHAEAMMEPLGIKIVWIPFGEMMAGVKTGVVDGAVTGTISGQSMGMDPVLKYAFPVSAPYACVNKVWVMNEKSFNKLPADLQQLVLDLGKEFEERLLLLFVDPKYTNPMYLDLFDAKRLAAEQGCTYLLDGIPGLLDAIGSNARAYMRDWAEKSPENQEMAKLMSDALKRARGTTQDPFAPDTPYPWHP